jgi:hypothetical protein
MKDDLKSQLLDELNQLIHEYPMPQEGDVDSREIMKERGISHSSSVELMHKICNNYPDKYQMIRVQCKTGGWKWVLRKK